VQVEVVETSSGAVAELTRVRVGPGIIRGSFLQEVLRMKRLVSCAIVALVAGVSVSLLSAAEEEKKPKYTIKEVMKFHKDKIHEKFSKGEATKEEKEKLLEGYESMLKLKPPKGDEKEWKEKCEALVKAVKDDDKDGLKKAVDCGACHGKFKK
jgi:hypothetical protein